MGIIGSVNAMAASMADDAVLKATFANSAFESFEASAYRSLLTMAKMGGFHSTIPLLEASLQEELTMHRWLEDHVEDITKRYVDLTQRGVEAAL